MNSNAEDMETGLIRLKSWLQTQSHLPHTMEDRILKRFLHSCYYDLEMTKKTVQIFFSLRSSGTELFRDRDPLSPPMQKAMNTTLHTVLKISGNRYLWMWQLNDPGMENYDFIQDAKLYFLGTDAWLLYEDNLEDSDILLLDVRDLTLKLITKLNIFTAKTWINYQEQAMPMRLKQIHVINTPSIIDKVFLFVKPLLSQRLIDMLHFHLPNSDTLYDYISKEDLPEDYGGTNGTLAEYKNFARNVINSQRELLIDNNLWKTTKQSKNDDNELAIGSFRSLALD